MSCWWQRARQSIGSTQSTQTCPKVDVNPKLIEGRESFGYIQGKTSLENIDFAPNVQLPVASCEHDRSSLCSHELKRVACINLGRRVLVLGRVESLQRRHGQTWIHGEEENSRPEQTEAKNPCRTGPSWSGTQRVELSIPTATATACHSSVPHITSNAPKHCEKTGS